MNINITLSASPELTELIKKLLKENEVLDKEIKTEVAKTTKKATAVKVPVEAPATEVTPVHESYPSLEEVRALAYTKNKEKVRELLTSLGTERMTKFYDETGRAYDSGKVNQFVTGLNKI